MSISFAHETPLHLDAALLTCAEMARCDQWTIQSGLFSGIELMANAGAAVADVVLAHPGDATGYDVLCGPGNNGGDGYVVASLLRASGCDVRVFAHGQPKPGTDAALAAADWEGPVEAVEAYTPKTGHVVIDALFGAGFRGDLPVPAHQALGKAVEAKAAIIAIDLPSGIDGDTGVASWAPDCAATVTFFKAKPAHCLEPARSKCGSLHVGPIGVVLVPDVTPATFENAPALWRHHLPHLPVATHKYVRGHAVVFSGPRHATGASRLAAMAAARAGAGAVTLVGTPGALDIHATHITSIMLKPCDPEDRTAALDSLNAPRSVLIGPGYGVGTQTRQTVLSLLQRASALGLKAIVLDADALSSFEDDPPELHRAIAACACPVILTPHAGEFARLYPHLAAEASAGKLAQARQAASRSGAIVVMKGPDTVIADPQGKAAINTNATPKLATAGSGDVLAGVIASLTAQSMPAFEAACAGVWLHAEAAKRAGNLPIAEDLIGGLGPVIAQAAAG